MTSEKMVIVSPIWQLGHVGKGADLFAEPPFGHISTASPGTTRRTTDGAGSAAAAATTADGDGDESDTAEVCCSSLWCD